VLQLFCYARLSLEIVQLFFIRWLLALCASCCHCSTYCCFWSWLSCGLLLFIGCPTWDDVELLTCELVISHLWLSLSPPVWMSAVWRKNSSLKLMGMNMYLSWDFEMQFYDHIVAKNYLGYISGQVTVLMQKVTL